MTDLREITSDDLVFLLLDREILTEAQLACLRKLWAVHRKPGQSFLAFAESKDAIARGSKKRILRHLLGLEKIRDFEILRGNEKKLVALTSPAESESEESDHADSDQAADPAHEEKPTAFMTLAHHWRAQVALLFDKNDQVIDRYDRRAEGPVADIEKQTLEALRTWKTVESSGGGEGHVALSLETGGSILLIFGRDGRSAGLVFSDHAFSSGVTQAMTLLLRSRTN